MININIKLINNNLVLEYKDKIIQIKTYPVLSKYEFDFLLLKSEEIVGCTGDMSISETISSNRIFVYQTLSHKLNFRRMLNKEWNEFYKEKKDFLLEIMFDPALITKRKEIEDFKKFKNKMWNFYEHLKGNSFLRWLDEKLEE
ncbi:uncharacterized protein VNE69_06028 [Vairimorpha necatrix]